MSADRGAWGERSALVIAPSRRRVPPRPFPPGWGVSRAAKGTEGREQVLLWTPRVQKARNRAADQMPRRDIDSAVWQVQRDRLYRDPIPKHVLRERKAGDM